MFNDFKFHEIPVAGEPESNRYESAIAQHKARKITGIHSLICFVWVICQTRNLWRPVLESILGLSVTTFESHATRNFWNDVLGFTVIGTFVITSTAIALTVFHRLSVRWVIANLLISLPLFYFTLMV